MPPTNSADMFFATVDDLQIATGGPVTLDPYSMPRSVPMLNPAVYNAFAMASLRNHASVGALDGVPCDALGGLCFLPASVGGMDYVGAAFGDDFTDDPNPGAPMFPDPSDPGSQFDQGIPPGGLIPQDTIDKINAAAQQAAQDFGGGAPAPNVSPAPFPQAPAPAPAPAPLNTPAPAVAAPSKTPWLKYGLIAAGGLILVTQHKKLGF